LTKWPLTIQGDVMKFAYADPPYPGMAHLYKDHPDYAGEVDHKALIERLVDEFPDGWALSTQMMSLRDILPFCPPDTETAVWIKPNENSPVWSKNPRNWSWEPVLMRGGRFRSARYRESSDIVRNYCIVPHHSIRIIGQKPELFCFWLFRCLGALPGDDFVDLFPGSGAVGRAWDKYQRQITLPLDKDYTRQRLFDAQKT
jgi:hypothetical protein